MDILFYLYIGFLHIHILTNNVINTSNQYFKLNLATSYMLKINLFYFYN